MRSVLQGSGTAGGYRLRGYGLALDGIALAGVALRSGTTGIDKVWSVLDRQEWQVEAGRGQHGLVTARIGRIGWM